MDTLPTTLPVIKEGAVLTIDPDEDPDVIREGEDALQAVLDENIPLIRSGTTYSYTESTRYLDSQEELADHEHSRSQDQFEPSVMTDYQASMFLPSLQLSSYSTIKQSKECAEHVIAQSLLERSMFGSKSVVMSLVEKLSDDRGAAFVLTIGNILAFLLGSAIFSMPFTVAAGGYVFIAAIILVSMLADITGILLADCLYEISPRSKSLKRVRLDYLEIASAAWGKNGSRIINFVQVFYLFALGIVNLVLLGNSFYAVLEGSLQHGIPLSLTAISAIVAVIVIPSLFIQRLCYLAYFSVLSIISIFGGIIALLVVFIQHSEVWTINASKIPLYNEEGFALGLSIMFYTVIAHPVLPQVEGSMRHPTKYKAAAHIAFSSSSVLKAIVSILGALTFGPATSSLVSLNVSKLSRTAGIVCNLVLCLYAIFSFPLNLFVVCEAFDVITLTLKSKFRKGGKYHIVWILLTRPFLVAIGLGIAIVVPYFGLLVGVLGSLLGTFLVFIFPCLFHIQLKRKRLSRCKIISEIILMLIGTAIGITGLYASVRGLVLATRGVKTAA